MADPLLPYPRATPQFNAAFFIACSVEQLAATLICVQEGDWKYAAKGPPAAEYYADLANDLIPLCRSYLEANRPGLWQRFKTWFHAPWPRKNNRHEGASSPKSRDPSRTSSP